MVTAKEVEAQLQSHEKVCAERYAGINAQLRRIERWVVAFFASMLAGSVGLAVTLVVKGSGG